MTEIIKDNAPRTFEQWIDRGSVLVPLHKGIPAKGVLGYTKENFKTTKEEWRTKYNYCIIGLRLDNYIDIDVDNPIANYFIEKNLPRCGAVSGRPNNPYSHYWYKGQATKTNFALPNDFKEHCKDFKHGSTLIEIRSGSGCYSVPPKNLHFKDKEYTDWHRFEEIREYEGDVQLDVGKVALLTALSILYPDSGQRDDYCTAIAGVLLNNGKWSAKDVDEFIEQLAEQSNDPDRIRSKKGTSGERGERNFGIPTLKKILNCSAEAITTIFSWVNATNSVQVIHDSIIGRVLEVGEDSYHVEVLKTDGDERTMELVEVDGPKLMKQQSFYDQCIEQAGVWIPAIPRVKFDRMMKEKFDNRERSEDYDEDAGESSKFRKTFIEYLKHKKVSNDRLALIRNEPVIEPEEDILDFSIDDFETYLAGQNIKYNKRGRLVEHLRKRLKAKKVKGKKPGDNNKSKVFWRIKNFSKQYEMPTGIIMLEGEIVDEKT